MVSVFLSHSSKDKPFVRNLADALEAGGKIKAWLDEREINYGDNIVRKIEEGLDADFVLLILSPDSVDSKWVREERTDAFWEQVNEDRIKLGIVLYRECKMPRLLRNKLYFDLRADHPEGFRKIRTWLLGHRPAPPPVVHLPQKPPLFIGRQPELAALRTRLQQEGSVVYIPGTPGRGKTTLALHYAHLHQRDFEAVHWLPCQSRSLAQIAAELTWQLGLKLDGDLDTILRELTAHCARKRCLLILDNVDDEAPARLLPNGRASVLITTRRNDLDFLSFHRPLDLPLFTDEQCFELFREVIGAAEVDRHTAEARAIFVRLDHLPIGIAVAAKLIRKDPRYTIAGMAKNLPAGVTALLAEAIAALTPAAQTLLAAMAACAPDGFRLSLAAQIVDLDEQSSLDALYEIYARSLAEELDRDTHRYRLHALVREAAGATHEHGVEHAIAVMAQFGNWEADWQRCEKDLSDWRIALIWMLEQSGEEFWKAANNLAYTGYSLTRRVGRLPEACEVAALMTERASNRGDLSWHSKWLGNQALAFLDLNQPHEAMAMNKRAETLYLRLNNKRDLATCYGNQALILRAWGQLDKAMTLYKREEALCRKLSDKDGLQRSYGNQAAVLYNLGQFDKAMILYKRQQTLCEELDDEFGLSASYGGQAVILGNYGRLEEAMSMHKQVEALCLKLGHKEGLCRCYGNQGLILKAWGRLDDAMALHEQEEALCVELGDKAGLATSYANQGLITRSKGDSKTGRSKLQQALVLFTELGMPRERDLVQSWLDQADALPSTE